MILSNFNLNVLGNYVGKRYCISDQTNSLPKMDDYVTVDDTKDPQAFALKVKGNSMSPRIEDGDVVIVSPQQEARSGDICVARVNGEDTLKKVKFEGNYIHLIPLNPEFDPVTVKKRDVNFVWKVVKLIKEL